MGKQITKLLRFWAAAAVLLVCLVAGIALCCVYPARFINILTVLAASGAVAVLSAMFLAPIGAGRVIQAVNRTPEQESSAIFRELEPVLKRLGQSREQLAETTRREFSANVSHELKTPLQSILGSGELLQNGLVQPEDVPRFAGHITTEASRLLALINDIIRISQLDEHTEIAKEPVDLKEIAREVLEQLQPAAQKKQVSLVLEGDGCVYTGVRRYLYEIFYNLCDNAIRYNKEGGRVTVRICREKGGPVVQVEDTGIGIPAEHQERIFERFYRVDKSHSKETGGTGLGLSIVKHAVAYHDGTVELESTPGKGTTVRVRL